MCPPRGRHIGRPLQCWGVSMTRIRASFLLAFVPAMVAAGGAADRAAAPEPRIRIVYVAALNASGAPVTDLTAADFTVKEGGKARDVIRAGPAAAPMHIAILIDDDGT